MFWVILFLTRNETQYNAHGSMWRKLMYFCVVRLRCIMRNYIKPCQQMRRIKMHFSKQKQMNIFLVMIKGNVLDQIEDTDIWNFLSTVSYKCSIDDMKIYTLYQQSIKIKTSRLLTYTLVLEISNTNAISRQSNLFLFIMKLENKNRCKNVSTHWWNFMMKRSIQVFNVKCSCLLLISYLWGNILVISTLLRVGLMRNIAKIISLATTRKKFILQVRTIVYFMLKYS